mmetsp:Transcript_8303/g.24482  ORF Transcript_8303/g.24482 Transcript_8303/m.24482 type:complete len:253 (+) Transcript_8303:215-973(+)
MQKEARSVLRLRPKQMRMSPSHSRKSTSMGGSRGTMRTTMESTSGGGLKLPRATLHTHETLTKSLVFSASRPYWDSPTSAMSRSANSFWNMSTAQRKDERCARRRNTKGEEIWYGKFAVQTSKIGHSPRRTSTSLTSRFVLPALMARFRTSAAMRGSISCATTRLPLSSNLIVRFPVPGPISNTVSVGLMSAAATILSTIPGFFSMCWPCFLLTGRLEAAVGLYRCCFDVFSLRTTGIPAPRAGPLPRELSP